MAVSYSAVLPVGYSPREVTLPLLVVPRVTFKYFVGNGKVSCFSFLFDVIEIPR